jgi:small-conductance mechanosensitive channel
MLLVFKPFRIGDQIELVDSAAGPNVQGRVTDLTLMYVVLREELDDGTVQMVQIPNNLFFQKTIRRKGGRRSIELDDYVDKHGLAGREQSPPTEQ